MPFDFIVLSAAFYVVLLWARQTPALQPEGRLTLAGRLHGLLFANMKYRLSAIALAALIWGISFFGGGVMVKSVSAPVEFINVASGLYISNQTAGIESVELRGEELRALRYSFCKSGGGFEPVTSSLGN